MLIAAGLLLAACDLVGVPTGATATPDAGSIGRTLVVCTRLEPETLYHVAGHAPVQNAVYQALYDGLIDTRDYNYQPVAFTKLPTPADGDVQVETVQVDAGERVYDAATGRVVTLPVSDTLVVSQADGSLLTVEPGATELPAARLAVYWTLVPGLTWQDGVPVTADDFVFAFEVAAATDAVTNRYIFERSDTFTAPDERTLRWVAVPGYTSSTYFLDPLLYPLPRHLYADRLTPAGMLADEGVNRNPLAYGPFKLDEWVAGDHLALSRNPTYWRADEGLPKLDRLVIRFVPDPAQLVADLAAGKCDLATRDAGLEDLPDTLRPYELQGRLVKQVVPGTLLEHLDFNQHPDESYGGFAGAVWNDDGTPIFANPQIRQALAACIDRAALVAEIGPGLGFVQNGYILREHPLYPGDGGLAVVSYDPARALALLEQNGWQDTDDDEILDRNGQKFSFVYSARRTVLRERVTARVQEMLKANCKVEAQVELVGSEYFEDGPRGMVFGRKFDVAEFSWQTGMEPACDLYLANRIPGEENGWGLPNVNDTGYADPAFDAACLEARHTLFPAVWQARHIEAQQIWAAALPSVPLFTHADIVVLRPGVTGVQLDATANSELWNVEEFDVGP